MPAYLQKSILPLIVVLAAVPIFFRFMRRPFVAFVRNPEQETWIDLFIYLMEIYILAVVLAYFVGQPVIQVLPGVYLRPDNFEIQIIFVTAVLIIVGALRLVNRLFHQFPSDDVIIWIVCGAAILFYRALVQPEFIGEAIAKVAIPSAPQLGQLPLLAFAGSVIAVLYGELLAWLYIKLHVHTHPDPDDAAAGRPRP